MAAANPIPAGFNSVSTHLVVQDAAKAIEFYKQAFGAEEICRMPGPGGQGVMHAELRIGNSIVMLASEMPQCDGPKSPQTLNGTTVSIHLYVKDVDAIYDQAVKAGATATMPAMDAFWGDRYGKIQDPFGHVWGIATRIKDLTPEEINQGAEDFFKQMAEQGSACQN